MKNFKLGGTLAIAVLGLLVQPFIASAQNDGPKSGVTLSLTAYRASGFYDRDGESQDYSNDQVLKGRQARLKGYYNFGNYSISGKPALARAFAGLAYKTRKWTIDGDDARSVTALTNVFLGAGLKIPQASDKLGVGASLTFYLDTENAEIEELRAGEGQNGVRLGLMARYRASDNLTGRFETDFLYRFDASDQNIDYNEGNLCLGAVGAAYHSNIAGNPAQFGLDFVYYRRGNQSFNGDKRDDSNANRIGINPFVKVQTNVASFKLEGALDSFGRREGAIPISGKSIFRSNGLTLSANYRF